MVNGSSGQYFVKGTFIAIRDTNDSSWRINRITINPDTSLTLTFIQLGYDYLDAEFKMGELIKKEIPAKTDIFNIQDYKKKNTVCKCVDCLADIRD